MPTVANIKKTMRKTGIPAKLIAQFEFPKPKGNQIGEALSLINQMDKLLTREQCLAVMEEQGCSKTEKFVAPFREFAQTHAAKTVEDKIELMSELNASQSITCRLNPNGTLSFYWGFRQDDSYRCICRKINCLYKERGEQANISSTFCGCCAGHVRYAYQLALGVELRLKEIVSSPLDSGGKNHCEFLFEIVG